MTTLRLPTVTLCAAASVNVGATVSALSSSLDQAEFAECLLFTHEAVLTDDARIRVILIDRLNSASDYSDFILRGLVDHVKTSHCLIVQWDGFVIDAQQWDPVFLQYDYIGAHWPQFGDGHDVGNGGFSLRSRRLLDACMDPRFSRSHPEDVAICRTNRLLLECECGLKFAGRTMADRFSFERSAPPGPTFGFHGAFNIIPALGPERFWDIYRTLDDRGTVGIDYWLLMRQLGRGRNAFARRARMTTDRLGDFRQARGTVTNPFTSRF